MSVSVSVCACACVCVSAGYYGAATALTSANCSGPCPAGYGCAAGTTSPQPCSPGTYSTGGTVLCNLCPGGVYGDESALRNASCSGPCPAGHACPRGTANATAYQCTPGRYSTAGATACTVCPPGQYGQAAGLTTATCSGDCTVGHYCPAGAVAVVRGAATVVSWRGRHCVCVCRRVLRLLATVRVVAAAAAA